MKLDMDEESENLQLLLNLNYTKPVSTNINALCDYNQNFCLIKATKGDLYLLWATIDNSLEVYDINKEITIDKIKAHEDWINSVHHFYDPHHDKDIIISCSDDKTIKLWEFNVEGISISSYQCPLKNTLTIKQDTIGNFRNAFMFTDFEDNINYIVVELSDYMIAIYNHKGQYLRKFDGCIFFDTWVDESSGRSHLVTGYGNKVKLFDFKSGKNIREFHTDSTSKCVVSAVVNNLLILADDTGSIKTFDIKNGNFVREFKQEQKEEVENIKMVQQEGVSSPSLNTYKKPRSLSKGDYHPITELSIWDIEYFFAASNSHLDIFETKNLFRIRSIANLNVEKVIYAQSFIHPRYGPALAYAGPMLEDSDKGVLNILTVEKPL
jgi:WD40 repeat protein